MENDGGLLVLEDKDVAQIDATVMVGVLIFLGNNKLHTKLIEFPLCMTSYVKQKNNQ